MVVKADVVAFTSDRIQLCIVQFAIVLAQFLEVGKHRRLCIGKNTRIAAADMALEVDPQSAR